jgi:hypothetical protein
MTIWKVRSECGTTDEGYFSSREAAFERAVMCEVEDPLKRKFKVQELVTPKGDHEFVISKEYVMRDNRWVVDICEVERAVY